jgi:hypothetical protein
VITFFDVHELRLALERIRRAAAFNDSLGQMLTALQSGDGDGHVVPVTLGVAAHALDADAAFVLLRDGDGWQVRAAQGVPQGLEGTKFSAQQLPEAAMAEANKAPVVVRSPQPRSLPGGVQATVLTTAPLVARAGVHGALLFVWGEGAREPDEADLDYLMKTGALIGLGLEAPVT